MLVLEQGRGDEEGLRPRSNGPVHKGGGERVGAQGRKKGRRVGIPLGPDYRAWLSVQAANGQEPLTASHLASGTCLPMVREDRFARLL